MFHVVELQQGEVAQGLGIDGGTKEMLCVDLTLMILTIIFLCSFGAHVQDLVDQHLRDNKEHAAMQEVMGGTFAQQIICRSVPHRSEKDEEFYQASPAPSARACHGSEWKCAFRAYTPLTGSWTLCERMNFSLNVPHLITMCRSAWMLSTSGVWRRASTSTVKASSWKATISTFARRLAARSVSGFHSQGCIVRESLSRYKHVLCAVLVFGWNIPATEQCV